MTIKILSLLLFIVFVILGSFHFYWLLGGTWGLEKVIPTKDNKISTIPIPKFATLIVALILILFGLVYIVKSGFINISFPKWIITYGYWFIPLLFILRAVGDFKYVGFFKKINHTEFAKADSKIFIPLCLLIGIIGVLIQLIDM